MIVKVLHPSFYNQPVTVKPMLCCSISRWPNQPCQQSYLSDGTTSYDFSTLVISLGIIGFVFWFGDDICAKCVAAVSPDCHWKNVFVWCVQPLLLSTWKLNAFTCFAAFSWGERIVEVDACGVQLVFGKYDFDY